ncbi:Helix-turn-helix domain protein [compost metagenome]
MGEFPPIVSIDDVADYFKVSRSTIFRAIYAGKLKSFKLGKHRRIRREWITEYEESLINNQ